MSKYTGFRLPDGMIMINLLFQPTQEQHHDHACARSGQGEFPGQRQRRQRRSDELIRRANAGGPQAAERINLVGPDTLTGTDAAAIWSEVLGRQIAYAGDDTAGFEQNLRNVMPGWMTYDMRLMAERFQSDGMLPEAGDVARLTAMLGRPLRNYRDYVASIATQTTPSI